MLSESLCSQSAADVPCKTEIPMFYNVIVLYLSRAYSLVSGGLIVGIPLFTFFIRSNENQASPINPQMHPKKSESNEKCK